MSPLEGKADGGTELLRFLLSQQCSMPAKGVWEDIMLLCNLRNQTAGTLEGKCDETEDYLKTYERGN